MIVAFRRHTQLPLDDCLLRFAANNPALDPFFIASVFAAARHL